MMLSGNNIHTIMSAADIPHILRILHPKPKAKFTPEDDNKLYEIVKNHGANDWNTVALLMGSRNARQCRERWKNYIDPELNKAPWSEKEDQLILEKFKEIGPKWKTIAKLLMDRGTNAVKNRFVYLQKQMSTSSPLATSPPIFSPVNLTSTVTKSFPSAEEPHATTSLTTSTLTTAEASAVVNSQMNVNEWSIDKPTDQIYIEMKRKQTYYNHIYNNQPSINNTTITPLIPNLPNLPTLHYIQPTMPHPTIVVNSSENNKNYNFEIDFNNEAPDDICNTQFFEDCIYNQAFPDWPMF